VPELIGDRGDADDRSALLDRVDGCNVCKTATACTTAAAYKPITSYML
jgi:hypothetical protein